MVTLTIDGKEVTVEENTVVIDAAEQAGIKIPRFCYHKKLKPEANCRICLVEIEGARKLMTSCSTPVAEGMVVKATSPAVLRARDEVMSTILASHPLDCPVCDQGGECDLQDFAERNTQTVGKFMDVKNTFSKSPLSPFIEKELNRCVTCTRCVRYCRDYMKVAALAAINRGNHTEITTFMGRELSCEFCGGCIEICPVGALTNKKTLYNYRPWQLEKATTICPHCADGCSMFLHTKNGDPFRVTYDWNSGRNQGSLCAKGYFGLLPRESRLAEPLARKHKKLVAETWPLAMEEVADKLTGIIAEHGPEAVAGMISGRCSNEDIYMFQKLFREVIGSNNIDSTLRYGPINSMKAADRVLGSAGMMNSFEDIENADNIIVIGADITETNPVVGYKIKTAVHSNNAVLSVVDPFSSEIARLASGHLSLDINTAVSALAAEVCRQGVKSEIPGVEKIAAAASEPVENTAGFADIVRDIALQLLSGKKTVIIVGQRVAEDQNGYNQSLNILDLAILSGLLGQAGSGVNFLYEETNASGLAQYGAGIDFSIGFAPLNNTHTASGNRGFMRFIDDINDGKIKSMIIVGENPVSRLPASSKIKKALASLDLLVVLEQHFNETVEVADYIFPTAGFAEKDGSFTNVEGITQQFSKLVEPVGISLPDWVILSRIAGAMGKPLEYIDTADLRKEMQERLAACSTSDSTIEQSARCAETYIAGLSADEISRRYTALTVDGTNGDYRLLLGPVLFHSGRITTSSKDLNELSNLPKMEHYSPKLSMNEADAKKLGLNSGDRVKVSTGNGETACNVEIIMHIDNKYPAGVLFFPEHYTEPSLYNLLDCNLSEPFSSLCFKSGVVSLEKV